MSQDTPKPTKQPEPRIAERRQSPRAPLHARIQYRFETFEQFLAEYSTDISVGGMFIRTESPGEPGSFVHLRFALEDGARLIEGLGRVVRVNRPGEPGRPPGMGIEFIGLDPESAELIQQMVSYRLAKRDGDE